MGSAIAGRFADDVEDGVVVLAAGGDAVDDHVGDRHVRGGERRFGLGLLRLGGFDLLGQFAWRCCSSAGRSSGDALPTSLLAAF